VAVLDGVGHGEQAAASAARAADALLAAPQHSLSWPDVGNVSGVVSRSVSVSRHCPGNDDALVLVARAGGRGV
jgi:hypothetical protein